MCVRVPTGSDCLNRVRERKRVTSRQAEREEGDCRDIKSGVGTYLYYDVSEKKVEVVPEISSDGSVHGGVIM